MPNKYNYLINQNRCKNLTLYLKSNILATITLNINERNKFGKAILELIKIGISENKGVELVKIPNDETIKAIEEINLGKLIKAENATELIKKLNS